MTFTIKNLETNQVIKLAEFDNIYCEFHNRTPHDLFYAEWFLLLEFAFRYYADLADNCNNDCKLRRGIVKEYRKLDCDQLCRALLISSAMSFDAGSDLELVTYFIKFLKHYNKTYEFEFHF